MENAETERCFIAWNSYLGYTVNEQPQMDLTYIVTNKNITIEETIREVILMADAGEIRATSFDVIEGSRGTNYQLMTLSLELPELNTGVYHISEVKIIEDAGKSTLYGIGMWTIEVRGEVSLDVEYGRSSFLNGVFAEYYSEIINDSNQSITVLGLDFELENKPLQIIITESENMEIETKQGTRVVSPRQMKFFNFQFIDVEGKPIAVEEFVVIKPFLIYEKNGERMYTTMQKTIYSPVCEESDILRYIGQGNE